MPEGDIDWMSEPRFFEKRKGVFISEQKVTGDFIPIHTGLVIF
jgi:hypothetical protein